MPMGLMDLMGLMGRLTGQSISGAAGAVAAITTEAADAGTAEDGTEAAGMVVDMAAATAAIRGAVAAVMGDMGVEASGR